MSRRHTKPGVKQSRKNRKRTGDRSYAGAEAAPPKTKREERLLRELEAERIENLRLRQTIDAMKSGFSPDSAPLIPTRKKPQTREEKWQAQFYEQGRSAHGFSLRSYPRFLLDTLNATMLVRLIRKITLFFRRVRLVRLILAVSVMLSTTVLLLPFYVIVVPVMLILTGLTAFFSLFFSARMNKRLRTMLTGKHLYVFIATDDACLASDSFFCGNARELARRPDCAVLVVSPHNLGTAGLGGKGLFLTARKEADNLFLVRRHYYFNLRRRVLRFTDEQLTVVC